MTLEELIESVLNKGYTIRLPGSISRAGVSVVISHRGFIRGTGNGATLTEALHAAMVDDWTLDQPKVKK